MSLFLTERVKNNLPEAFIFSNPRTGRPYTESSLDRVWRGVRDDLDIKGIRLYDATRHSVASQLVNSGSSLFKVSKLLGHSTIKMTEKYAHEHVESLRSDLEKLSLKRTVTVPRLSPKAKKA
jgi:site-specific recombinase XerD